ncbi:MAG: hypothetical protein PHP86_02380 [Nevskiales bacterium]|nr:hypothetical protein [Nevskiales bacterium]
MNDYRSWLSLREVDLAAGAAKGSGFRLFKRLLAELSEGTDFVVLQQTHDHEAIERLRRDGRIYASSVNVVLLRPALAQRLAQLARAPAKTQR